MVATGNHFVFDMVAGVVGQRGGLRPRRRGRADPHQAAEHRQRSARPSPRPEPAQIASASTVPTTVSTVLVPTKNAATATAGTAVPVTGSKVAARIAAPAPTRGGREGHEAPAALREHDEQHGGGRRGQPEGGEEAGERAEPAARG